MFFYQFLHDTNNMPVFFFNLAGGPRDGGLRVQRVKAQKDSLLIDCISS